MAQNTCLATIRGVAELPEVNVRSGPGQKNPVVMKSPKGIKGVTILDVVPDEDGTMQDGKRFQWLQLRFSNGQVGWVRDDLVEIVGDCSAYGYSAHIPTASLAFSLWRDESRRPIVYEKPEDADEVEPDAMRSASQFAKTLVQRNVCFATIVGLPDVPSVNVRTGPGTAFGSAFQVEKGRTNLYIVDVRPDDKGESKNNKVYQWFNLAFPNGQTGWVRDDLITIQGNCDPIGYDELNRPVLAFNLKRETPVIIQNSRPSVPVTSVTGPAQEPTRPAPKVKATGNCVGIVISSIPAKVRKGPNVTYDIVTELAPGTKVAVQDIAPQEGGGGSYRWIQMEVSRRKGWIREDLLSFEGDCASFNLLTVAGDLFPAPMKRYTFTGGYQGESGHKGWDMALEDEPVFSAPAKGTVLRAHACTRCTADNPSSLMQGFPMGDPKVLNDPAWGWGFGNHIVVRYQNPQLPESTRRYLANQGLEGGHLFVVYAHLKEMSVRANQELTGEVRLGTCGNTGQSSGPHLHLEVRSGTDPQMGPWLRLKLLDPAIAFKR